MSWEKVKLQLISDEGAVLELLVYCYCRTERATLVANVERIQTTMVRGNIREYRFMIANSGGGETGEIRVTPPKAEWLSLATSEIIPSLKQGESTSVVLRLTPAEEMLRTWELWWLTCVMKIPIQPRELLMCREHLFVSQSIIQVDYSWMRKRM